MALNTTESTSNATMIQSSCIVLQFVEFIPWNNPDNIISFQTEELVRRLKEVVFSPILFLIGAPANIINMAVFYKQGLKERINVCLFALSLADGLFLVFNMVWHGEQLPLQFITKESTAPLQQWISKHYLLGFYGFTWVSRVLSAIIASERCFCVLQPLRSRSVLKTSTITVVIVVIFVLVTGVYFIIANRYYIVCAYDPFSKSVIITAIGREFYLRHKKLVDFLDVFVYGVGLTGVVIVVVTMTTIMTTIKLYQIAELRARTSSRGGDGGGDGSGEGISANTIALTKMLVYNSVFFTICVFPFGLFRFVLLFMPEMNAGQRHHNLFMTCQWLINIFSLINSSFNIVIYYTMGSRYRQTLRCLFSCRLRTTRTARRAVGDRETTLSSKVM